MDGMIFDIDHFAIHDGDGIRTCIYLKGCPLKCKWCHSPESQSIKTELLFVNDLCKLCGICKDVCPNLVHQIKNNRHIIERENCELCGKCTKNCPAKALQLSGKIYSSQECIEEALQDKVFYKNSGGGVTLTGGEVLLQAEFAIEVLKGLKLENIHSIVETSGYGDSAKLLAIAEYTDIFYYDLKIIDNQLHKDYTNAYNDIILNNLYALKQASSNIVIRIPLIPNITDTNENIISIYELASKLNIKNVHLLPYNSSAAAKYEWLEQEYQLDKVNSQNIDRLNYLKEIAPKELIVEII